MNRIIGWLESILTRRPDSAVDDLADDSPDDHAVDVPSEAEVDDQKDEGAVTAPHLEDLDVDLSDTDKFTGVDPYDTAQLQKK